MMLRAIQDVKKKQLLHQCDPSNLVRAVAIAHIGQNKLYMQPLQPLPHVTSECRHFLQIYVVSICNRSIGLMMLMHRTATEDSNSKKHDLAVALPLCSKSRSWLESCNTYMKTCAYIGNINVPVDVSLFFFDRSSREACSIRQ
jgi:hypothetical protein